MVLNLRHKGVFLDVVTYFLFIFGVLVFFGAGVGAFQEERVQKNGR